MSAEKRGEAKGPRKREAASSPSRGKRALPPSRAASAAFNEAVDLIITTVECLRLENAYSAVKNQVSCGPDDYMSAINRAMAKLPSGVQFAERYSLADLEAKLLEASSRLDGHVRAHEKGYGDRLRRDYLRQRIGDEFAQAVGKTRSITTRTTGGVTTVLSRTLWTATALRRHLAGTYQLANESSVRRLLSKAKKRT